MADQKASAKGPGHGSAASPLINNAITTAWKADKNSSTTAKAALAKRYTNTPFKTGPNPNKK